ncbi:MAG: transcriptional regulator [Syntrophomonadaceae bacterium]|nr:transcriptional regulator [Syntrophomonadaceae bacterium]MDD4548466.1 transcriptional regulator [Syntrophomonadaceae bacterium]
MTFAEKLDLLMNITNTTNSVLARNISMDASFISRLRRGIRTPAKNVNYIQTMAEYFARNCRAEYQKTALREAIKSNSVIPLQDNGTVTEIIHKWLIVEIDNNTIDDFLEEVSQFKFKKAQPVKPIDVTRMEGSAASEMEVFYSAEGKQNAVITFLTLVLKNKNPQTLLLYSDENLEWLTDNRDFTLKWASLLAQVIRNGNKIKIIHTINRSFDEMLSAIKEWVPIYMTGAINPYYYPKTRDGLFRRTLFIAPDTAAVSSSSVGNGTENTANFLFTNQNTVKALIEEYNSFLALCRPLMHIFTPLSKGDYLSLLAEFEDEKADSMVKTDVFTNVSIPLDTVKSILARTENPAREQLHSYQQKRIRKFIDSLQKYKFTEICPLPDLEKILAGKAAVNFSDMLSETQLFYTPKEYFQHLKNIIQLLKTYENYNLYLIDENDMDGFMLYVKEDVGVLVGKTSLPSVVFAINESNMTAALWDYLNVILKKEPRGKVNKSRTIAELESIITHLEGMTAV